MESACWLTMMQPSAIRALAPRSRGDVEPGVGVLHLHGDIGNDALQAKEERGVAGNDLCVRISADIADLDLAVSSLVLVFDLAFVDELLQLHAGDNAADVAGLIDAGEGVVEVIKAVGSGGIAGHRDELHIGIFLSCQKAEGLMAVGVGDDDLAAPGRHSQRRRHSSSRLRGWSISR